MRNVGKLFSAPLYFLACFFEVSVFFDIGRGSFATVVDLLLFGFMTFAAHSAPYIFDKFAPVAE